MEVLFMKSTRKPPSSTPTRVQIESTSGLPEQIRCRAFELYEQRGREDGHELDDWLKAEEELTQLRTRSGVA
jgi:hypothetical protein